MAARASSGALRVGLLTTSYPRFAGDVCGNFVEGFAQTLAKRGHQVEVLAPDPGAEFDREPHSQGEYGNIRRITVPYAWPRRTQQLFYGAGVPENLSQSPWLLYQLPSFATSLYRAAAKRASTWDAVISHWALPCGLVASALPTSLPHLAVCHSADVFALSSLPMGKPLRKRIQERAHAMWFVAPAMRDRFLVPDALPPRLVHVGPMGFEPAADTPTVASRALRKAGPLRAVTLSRLVPIKGISAAIAAVRALSDVELTIAGDGPSRQVLEAEAQGCPRIRFVGALIGDAKARLLDDADVFLLPSRRLPNGRTEGVPCALLEAMHAALPVVVSDVGGVTSVVNHGCSGLVVPPDDHQALVKAIRRLRDEPSLALRLGREARCTASEFAWPMLGARIEALLDDGRFGTQLTVERAETLASQGV